MTEVTLDSIRNCLEGIIPSVMATYDAEGIPNVSMISQVHYVDPGHVALSYQFFNKTRHNVLTTRRAAVGIVDPDTNAQYRLSLDYVETRTDGPLFEIMRAKLAGIASHSGMNGVFRLLGSDVYAVHAIEPIPTVTIACPPAPNLLSAARRISGEICASTDLGELFDATLAGLERHFGIAHSMVMMLDETSSRLYTVASRGYPVSGIGSEVALGGGVIGVAASIGVPIRIGQMTSEYSYGGAIRESARLAGLDWAEQTFIPFPGLPEPESQIALPLLRYGKVIGVLFAESGEPNQFGYDDEDALSLVVDHLASMIILLQQSEAPVKSGAPAPSRESAGSEIRIRHYKADNTVFIGHDYLIKGVAGAILWKLASEYVGEGRVEFTNRELRLDPSLRLPEFAENLEARLLLLQRRLCERDAGIRMDKCGRGRFRLVVDGSIVLEDM